MTKRSLMLGRLAKTWGQKVRVITLDFDNHPKTFCEDVKGMDFDEKMTFYTTEDEDLRSAYFRKGFIHDSLIVDSAGHIVLRGQLEQRNLESDLVHLLQGEKLTGLGTTPNGH